MKLRIKVLTPIDLKANHGYLSVNVTYQHPDPTKLGFFTVPAKLQVQDEECDEWSDVPVEKPEITDNAENIPRIETL